MRQIELRATLSQLVAETTGVLLTPASLAARWGCCLHEHTCIR